MSDDDKRARAFEITVSFDELGFTGDFLGASAAFKALLASLKPDYWVFQGEEGSGGGGSGDSCPL